MFGKLGEMGGMFKKIQEMQKNLKKAQEELADLEVTGTSSGKEVEVLMTCDINVKRVIVSSECLATGESEIIGNMITSAVNDAILKAKETAAEKMSEITGGIDIPGLTG